METFEYVQPTTWDEATTALTTGSASQVIAGGTNLVDLMKLGVARPGRVVDVSRLLPSGIDRAHDGGLVIGAGVTNANLASSLVVRDHYPLVSQAVLAGASGQIRNTATVGGNILQRTRCVYFQDTTKACNKRDPGSGCAAIGGINRDMAILGRSDSCIATNPSDMAVAFAALDAAVQIRTADGATVTRSLDEFYLAPGDSPHIETSLAVGDIVTAVLLPPPIPAATTYRKVRDRASYAFALVSVAAAVLVDHDQVTDVRLAFGALAPKPWRARTAENLLRGKELTIDSVTEAIAAELSAAQTLPGNAFKVRMTTSIATEALLRLADTKETSR